MKHTLPVPLALVVLSVFLVFGACASSKKYSIQVQPLGMRPGDTLYMGAYKGESVLLYGKTTIDNKGVALFSGQHALKSGMYSIGAGEEKNSFDFLISDNQPQNFTVTYDTANVQSSIVFKGSDENTAFVNFYNNLFNDKLTKENERFPMLNLYIKSHSNDIGYGGYTRNYLDNIDFSDERIARMPLLEGKLYNYFFYIIDPLDTTRLKLEIDSVLYKAAANTEVYNLTTTFLYQIFINSPLPDHEQIAKYIGRNYILAGYTAAFDSTFIADVKEEINWFSMSPVGSIAPDLKLQSIAGDYMRLSDVNTPITILLFIDPDCGACREVAPLVYKLYKEYKNKGVEVYAVYVGDNQALWKEYSIKNKFDWINVWTNTDAEQVYANYNLLGMPTLYLLDKDKRILAKDISVEHLGTLLKIELK